jgi:hypothetical protein
MIPRSKNISGNGPADFRSLGYPPDEQRAFQFGAGRENCRSLGFARDDKGEGDASMESGSWIEAFFLTFPATTQGVAHISLLRCGRNNCSG